MAKMQSLIGEDENSFTVHDGEKELRVAKRGVGGDVHEKIRSLPKFEIKEESYVPAEIDPVSGRKRTPSELAWLTENKGKIPEDKIQNIGLPSLAGSGMTDEQRAGMRAMRGEKPLEQAVSMEQTMNAGTPAGPAPASSGAPVAVPIPTPVPAPQTPQQGAALNEMQMAQNQKIQAVNAEAEAMQRKAQEEQSVYGDLYSKEQMQRQQKNLEDLQAKGVALEQENEKLFKASMNNEIDPNRVWNNKSAGNKVMAVIGIMLGGAGSGGRAENNAALNIINKSIDDDIKAQLANKENTRSLYNMNLQKYRDNLAAQQATQLQLSAIAQGQLASLASKYNGETAKSRAQALIADMKRNDIVIKDKLMTSEAERMQRRQVATGADPMAAKIMALPASVQDKAWAELGEYNKIDSGLKRVREVLTKARAASTAGARITSPMASSSTRSSAEAELFPIAKEIVGEALQEADFKRMVKPFLPGLGETDASFAAKLSGFEDTLKAQVKGKTPILSSFGIAKPLISSSPATGAPRKK